MRSKITIIILLISLQLSAGWEPFSPEGINANRIRFYVDYSNHWAVCHNTGLYLYDLNSQSWTNYPTTLPVVDAAWLDGENTLVILNAGSYSDGIYSFNPGTGEYTFITWLEGPNFIVFDDETDRYFVGYRSGLKYSDDGLIWDSCSNFDNMNIVDMDIFGNHYVVSEMDNLYNIYYSDDAGLNWQTASNTPMISDLAFDYAGKLYGIYPDESWSSGLWSSNDFGENWNVEFWSVNMTCVGFDAMQDVFTGWQQSLPGSEEGIARWDSTNQNLTFFNQGLPELMINQITYNPAMSAMALFCCTQNGAYINYDYVGLDEKQPSAHIQMEAFPNPVTGVINIRYMSDMPSEIFIYSSDGKIIEQNHHLSSSGEMQFNCSKLLSGIYYIVMKSEHSLHVQKFIKR